MSFLACLLVNAAAGALLASTAESVCAALELHYSKSNATSEGGVASSDSSRSEEPKLSCRRVGSLALSGFISGSAAFIGVEFLDKLLPITADQQVVKKTFIWYFVARLPFEACASSLLFVPGDSFIFGTIATTWQPITFLSINALLRLVASALRIERTPVVLVDLERL
eukprot:NODE_5249_length_700_cov_24.019969_g4876_i0.p1 GENE.NODE_5249_length_700_cov_24.019969_g4876_i0~~NODE_5249_length_700_cov_24.019969_g4876_i0.p1  ORF type:complete len:168 (-),score=22.53 NODE_5249_length_700_cov_24.019969_g4876_i0:72-575(-)